MTTDITEMIGGIIDQYSDPVIIVIVPQGDGDGSDAESAVEDNSLVNDNWFSEGFWDQFYNAELTSVAGGGGGGFEDAILMDNPLQS